VRLAAVQRRAQHAYSLQHTSRLLRKEACDGSLHHISLPAHWQVYDVCMSRIMTHKIASIGCGAAWGLIQPCCDASAH
jgi:hypothetical protein